VGAGDADTRAGGIPKKVAAAETTGSAGTPRAPAIVERFVKQLNIAYKAVRLYPGSSEIPKEGASAAVALLRSILEREPVVRFVVTRDGLLYDGTHSLPGSAGLAGLATDLYARNLAEVRFHSGCSETDIVRFLRVLGTPAETIIAGGGFAAALWDVDVTAITVSETATRIVEDAGEEQPGPDGEPEEEWPPTPERLEEIVTGAEAGQRSEARLLVRVFGERATLRSYLDRPSGTGRAAASEAILAKRVVTLAHAVRFELPEEREALLRHLAEAVLAMDPQVRQRLIAKRLLSGARNDEAIAEMLRAFSIEEIMECLLHEISESDESRAGLSRAIRYLSLIGVSAPGEGVLERAATALRERGTSDSFIASVMSGAAPNRLDLAGHVRSSATDPVDSVLKLIDLTPDRGGPHMYDASVAPLREEATRGLTDGDVVAALVSIATLETRPEPARRLSMLVEDRIVYLLDLHEFEVAADAAATLTMAEQNETLPLVQRRRMRDLLQILSQPESMRKVTSAMRVYRHDSREYAACKRLLGVLGSYTVSSLLEVLAEEQTMAGRKAIVELLSGMAERFVPELGARVDDPRWFFVRNVVAILGTTHDPKTLQYFERTLRHPDERVRRETIRAVAGVRDALATQMLVAALSDDSAQNVGVAARYLGGIGGRGVVPALEQVARGEGRGNRETGARIEAIEALGRAGEASSARTLREIAQQRGLIAGRTRDVRAAAEAAIGALRARGVTEGAS
jgi:HEAT repeat protein